MASTFTAYLGFRTGLKSLDAILAREDETNLSSEISLPAAVSGTLTTRTNDSTGVITVASHSITTSDTVAVFWSGGYRYGVAVSATSGTTISIGSGGSGDNLPTQDTALTVCKESTLSFSHVGNDIKAMVVHSPQRMSMNVRDTVPASQASADVPANESWFWISNATGTNPFAGDTLQDIVLGNQSTSAQTATVLLLKNSV